MTWTTRGVRQEPPGPDRTTDRDATTDRAATTGRDATTGRAAQPDAV